MNERPILFSSPMIRALLEGRKSQTRRLVKPQPTGMSDRPRDKVHFGIPGGYEDDGETFYAWQMSGWSARSPYGAPGDRLWVRERFCMQQGKPIFRADAVADDSGDRLGWWVKGRQQGGEVFVEGPLDWKPSIHMPRLACRLVLELTAVRVERLQEISAEDVLAEGIVDRWSRGNETWEPEICEEARAECRYLWDSLNAKRAPWASNPWVWVLEFKIAAPSTSTEPKEQ